MVLDTNVVLDLLRYHDIRSAGLNAAMNDGRVQALTDPRCSAELERVLSYPVFALDPAAQAEVMRVYRAGVVNAGLADETDAQQLPRCSDTDDQKFLELAWRTGADLVTRDKALLKLGRRFAKLGRGRICKPEELVFRQACAGPPVGQTAGQTHIRAR